MPSSSLQAYDNRLLEALFNIPGCVWLGRNGSQV